LRSLATEAQTTVAALAAEQAARTRYIRQLRTQQRLDAAEVARLDQRASTAAARAPTVPPVHSVTPAATPAEAAPVAAHGTTLTVVATGYSISGSTSSGLPTGWGVAAVDPSVIPLGTHLSVPGYGAAVASDTGPAIQGAVIDLWFPSEEQALAWGRRTVSITLQ
jgi:3D (Asp-Asp-Asp) domain-containing protein